jgi:chorismate mutase
LIRGFRGATTVKENNKDEILQATKILLEDMTKENGITPDLIVSVIISVTNDLNAAFPAQALRLLDGWTYVPVMCTTEIPVPNSLSKCIRIMLTAETSKRQEEVIHIYHNEAKQLRPDLIQPKGEKE